MLPPSTELGPIFASTELGPEQPTLLRLAVEPPPITTDPGPSVTDGPLIILEEPKIELGPDPVSIDAGPT